MPSAANFARREAERLASLTFFLDYQIGRYVVAEALRAAGANVEVHIDHFGQAAPDIEWIPEVGRREWVLITKDDNIRRNPLERAAYEDARLRGFVVTGKDMSGRDLAILLTRCLAGMARQRGRPAGAVSVYDFAWRNVDQAALMKKRDDGVETIPLSVHRLKK